MPFVRRGGRHHHRRRLYRDCCCCWQCNNSDVELRVTSWPCGKGLSWGRVVSLGCFVVVLLGAIILILIDRQEPHQHLLLNSSNNNNNNPTDIDPQQQSLSHHPQQQQSNPATVVVKNPPLPLGPDGLPLLQVLLDHHESLRATSQAREGQNQLLLEQQQQQQRQQQIEQQNALLNSNQCPLPPQCQIIEIPIESSSTSTSSQQSFKLAVWADGDFISEELVKKKAWEIRTLQDMAALAPSSTQTTTFPTFTTHHPDKLFFYDIGANVGYYTFLFAVHGYTSIAVEPEPGNVALLHASACLNPHLNVTIVPVAVTNDMEILELPHCRLWAQTQQPRMQRYLHASARLTCTVSAQSPCFPSRTEICVDPVNVTTLAQLLPMHHYPTTTTTTTINDNNNHNTTTTIVKIDVEGHELQALQGLLLTSSWNNVSTSSSAPLRPQFIQFENKNPRIAQNLTDLLVSAGYTVGTARGHDQNTVAELVL